MWLATCLIAERSEEEPVEAERTMATTT